MKALRYGEAVLVTLWVGSLWTVGYVVAPMLFAELDDRSLAGDLAGSLFTIETWITLACGLALIGLRLMRGNARWANADLWLPALMMLLLAVSEFAVGPALADIRAAGGAGSRAFVVLHGVSATLYLIASVSGLFLVSRIAGRAGDSAY